MAPQGASGGGLPEDRARRIEVRLSGGGRTLELLRRQVEGRAARLAQSLGAVAVDLHGSAEVGQHDLAGRSQRRFDGLRSPWTIPSPCRNAKVARRPRAVAASSSASSPSGWAASRARNVPPAIHSMASARAGSSTS